MTSSKGQMVKDIDVVLTNKNVDECIPRDKTMFRYYRPSTINVRNKVLNL